MEEKLCSMVKENTLNEKYKLNNATMLGKRLGLSRNWISQYLNEYYNNGTFLKINTRPVVFIDKKALETKFQIHVEKTLLASFEELRSIISANNEMDFQKLIGYNGSLRNIVDRCKASISYPPHGLPILFVGETGTGKSTIAHLMYEYALHHGLLKKEAHFIHVNCSEYANNPELITANLFGYKKGAFTGADTDRFGLIKQADGGVLFLDEVHCLKPECQEKLFLFMDKGEYRMLGDSEKTYHGQVLFIFATTENPDITLLKTLRRRIPIRIDIPSLKERGVKEKAQIITASLKREAQEIHKNISISNIAFNALLNKDYNGNIGEVFNVIKETCMNALYRSKKDNDLEIHTLHLPENLISEQTLKYHSVMFQQHKMLTLSQLLDKTSRESQWLLLCDELLQYLQDLQNNQLSMQEYVKNCVKQIETYFHDILYKEGDSAVFLDSYIQNTMKTVIQLVSDRYGYTLQSNEIFYISYLIKEYMDMQLEIEEYLDTRKDECNSFIHVLEKKCKMEYMLSTDTMQTVKLYLDIEMPSFFTAIFTLIIYMKHNYPGMERIAVILAHGYATASSMASAVNELLDEHIFDAIDMPLDTTTEAIISKLKLFLMYREGVREMVLLVDMGSLEEIYVGISELSRMNVALANNVTTKMALTVGENLRKETELEKVFENCRENGFIHFYISENNQKEKIILCSCATGIGTAEKLKTILVNSLPESIPLKVLTYDYSTLLENKLEDKFFKGYEIICIVGTLNPQIQGICFIPIEELIMGTSSGLLRKAFKGYINEADMEILQKNILKNFSLSNIIGNLTILNPDKLLEHVAEAIDHLQSEMKISFSNNICFGLYVHICCLIERLVTKEGIEEYMMTRNDCSDELKEFVCHMKIAFKKVEAYYSVSIPIEEIQYIYIYISNMQ